MVTAQSAKSAQEQAPRGRDLQSTLLFFGSFGKTRSPIKATT